MAALRSRCGHYIFVLFLLFYSSPNLSGRRMDVLCEKFHQVDTKNYINYSKSTKTTYCFIDVSEAFIRTDFRCRSSVSKSLSHMCSPSANLERRSEICCTRLAGKAGPKKSPKIGHLGTIAQLYRAKSLQLKHISTIGKKTC